MIVRKTYVSKTQQWSSNISMHQNYLKIVWKQRLLCPKVRISHSVGLGQSLRTRFLESSQVILMLLVPGPHFENYCINRIHMDRETVQGSSHSKNLLEFNSICLKEIFYQKINYTEPMFSDSVFKKKAILVEKIWDGYINFH